MEQQDLNKRLLLVLVFAIFIFAGSNYFFPVKPKQVSANDTNVSTLTKTTNRVAAPTPVGDTLKPKTSLAVTAETIVTVKSDIYSLSMDAYGRVSQVELLQDKYLDENDETAKLYDNVSSGTKYVRPLAIRFSTAALDEEAAKTPYVYTGSKEVDISNGPQTLTFTQTLSSLTLTKKITFYRNGKYDVEVTGSTAADFFITPGHRPVSDKSMYMLVRGALIKTSDNLIKTIEDGDMDKAEEKYAHAKIASAFDRYLASMFFDFNQGLNVSIMKDGEDDPLIFVHGNKHLAFSAYIGPKETEVLKSIHPELVDAIEFGWFSFIAKPFYSILLWINGLVGNWGWAIILFTLLIKMLLFPLTYKGMMSMQKLKDLAPKMKALKEKYKGNPSQMNVKMMEMYKNEKVNPMGGCLPLLLQIPVFFALYRVLLNAVELEGAPWILWIENLAMMDPYYVLPVLMGVSMWFQQRITPSNFQDPLQEKIFKWFPVLMTVFFVYFPSGLVLYWLVNNLFTIAQQYYINRMYAKQKANAIATHTKKKG